MDPPISDNAKTQNAAKKLILAKLYPKSKTQLFVTAFWALSKWYFRFLPNATGRINEQCHAPTKKNDVLFWLVGVGFKKHYLHTRFSLINLDIWLEYYHCQTMWINGDPYQ